MRGELKKDPDKKKKSNSTRTVWMEEGVSSLTSA